MNDQNEEREGYDELEDSDYEESSFDWPVFLGRVAAFLVFGATLATSFDVSINQNADWLTVMRLAIQPFALGVLILMVTEFIERRTS